MQIFIKLVHGKTVTIQVQPQTKIRQIAKHLQDNIDGVVGRSHRFGFAGRQLQHDRTLSDYYIQKQSILQHMYRWWGGGITQFLFNSLTEPVYLSFNKKAPQWRIVGSGLNIEGQCQNQNCQAYTKRVWVRKGLGKFNIGRLIDEAVCVCCEKQLKNVNNLGITNASMKIQGKLKDSSEITVKWYDQFGQRSGKAKFLTFQNQDETQRTWCWLQAQVRPWGWYW